jgi:exopolysaccharide biosynthesis polyprenyl glycosylphosphotransferase
MMNEHIPNSARRQQHQREQRFYTLGLPLIDIALALAAFVLAYILRYEWQIFRPVFELNRAPFDAYFLYAAVYIAWLYVSYRGSGLYRPVRARAWLEEVYSIVNGVTNATVVMMAISFFAQPLVFSRLMFIYVAIITIVLLAAARSIQRTIQGRLRSKGFGVQRALVVGAGEVGRAVLRTMIARRELGYDPVGYLDDNPERGSVDIGRVRGLGSLDNLEAVLREHPIDMVLITLPWKYHDKILELIRQGRRAGVEISVVPDVFQLNLRQVQVENLDGIPLLRVNGHVALKGSNRLLKRAIDIALITLSAPLWLPLFGVVALAIRIESPGAIFYCATRVGENGRRFQMFKFRSMIPNADRMRAQLTQTLELDPRRPKIKNDPRVTRVGRIIRATSIDELPNLFNVLLGHMSLVGPRPPTPDEVELYEPWHLQRLQTLPGMTGLWQVSGRSEVPFEEMCLMDIYYIENWSIALDAQILMMTIPRVLLRQGAY